MAPTDIRRRHRSEPEEDYSPREREVGATPTRRRRGRPEDTGDEPSRTRRDRGSASHAADIDDDRPARRDRSRRDDRTQASGRRGWGAYTKARAAISSFPDQFKVSDEEVLIKFVEPEPFATFSQHWLNEITEGKRSFVCLEDDCPLCDDLGDQARLQVCFNIVDYTNPEHPELKVWSVGSRLAQTIETFAQTPKNSPINREDLFWSVSKSGKGTQTSYQLTPVKERDLEDDWGLDVDAVYEQLDQIKKSDLHDESFVKVDSRRDLAAIADELAGD